MADARLRFEHQIIKPLRDTGGRWLLAVSGGVDSMVLAEVLVRWTRWLKIEIAVAHVHHGTGGSARERAFRARARGLVEKWCAAHGIAFFTNEAESVNLRSEADLRSYRLEWLARWRAEVRADFVVFAHHQDDLLETRMSRLIRGTGAAGLPSMRLKNGARLRPLLEVTRAEIEAYARARRLKFVDDPSNRSSLPLRNWLRREWLPALEKKRPGAVKALGRSLEILSRQTVVESPRDVLRRVDFDEQNLAAYLRGLGLKNYGRAHVREILKRAQNPSPKSFIMLGHVFEITQDLLKASRV